jgi:hypothetical protein
MMPPTFPPPQGVVCRADMLKTWRYSMTRVAAGAFGFLIFSHAFEGERPRFFWRGRQ